MKEHDTNFNGQNQSHLLTVWLLGSTIIVIQFATQEVQPIFEIQDLVVQEIAWTSFNQQYPFLWQVLR